VDGTLANVSTKQVIEAARQGDRLSLDLLQNAGGWLGMALATAINLFSPQKIVLTGGVMRGNDLLLAIIQEAAERYALPQLPRPLPIVMTELDDQVGALGAATLILDREFEAGFAERLSRALA
jgi:predicted NBD/HSP70 family sugar kinase